jgi:flagellar biosynthesis protein FliR
VNLPAELLHGQIALAALELARLSGVVAVSPVPWHNAPGRARVGLLVFLLVLVHGHGDSPVREMSSAGWVAVNTFTEFVIGACIGMFVRLCISAAEIMGEAIAPTIGFSAAQVFDPSSGSTDSVLTNLIRMLALLVAITTGLHRVMLAALISSFHFVPVGTALHIEASFPIFLELSGHMLGVGVRLALPVLAVLLMVNVGLGFVARAAPTIQIFNVGFAVLLGVGAAVLYMTLPDFSRVLAAEMGRAEGYFARIFAELGAGP